MTGVFDPFPLITVWMTRSANYTPPGQYVKCFHNTEHVLTLHNHFPTRCLQGNCLSWIRVIVICFKGNVREEMWTPVLATCSTTGNIVSGSWRKSAKKLIWRISRETLLSRLAQLKTCLPKYIRSKNLSFWTHQDPLIPFLDPFVPFRPIGPIWIHCNAMHWDPCWPIWTNLDPFGTIGLIRAHLDQLGPILTYLNPFASIWIHLDPFGPIWTLQTYFDPSGPIWTHLTHLDQSDPFGPICKHLDLSDPFWPIAIHWTWPSLEASHPQILQSCFAALYRLCQPASVWKWREIVTNELTEKGVI